MVQLELFSDEEAVRNLAPRNGLIVWDGTGGDVCVLQFRDRDEYGYPGSGSRFQTWKDALAHVLHQKPKYK